MTRHTRRGFLTATGASAAATLAGCLGSVPGTSPDTVRVGTYKAFVDAPSTSAGDWVKQAFEEQTDLTLEWVVRENELSDFIRRRREDVPLEADAFIGVTPQDLVRADRELDDDHPLFEGFATDQIENAANVVDAYHFDPERRVLPTGASYVCIVYDEGKVSAPPTLEALTGADYQDSLLLANPQSTATGLLFLLWTVHTVGEENYLDYWRRLMDNDVHVLGTWSDSYSAYSNEEAPMVVSYSTDQVYAANADQDMSRHQIAFPNDQGYAYVDGLAKFATTDRDELVRRFASFMLQPDVQRETAVQNVGLPTVSNASLPEKFQQYAHVPDDPIQFGYDTLAENMDAWRDEWAKQVASG